VSDESVLERLARIDTELTAHTSQDKESFDSLDEAIDDLKEDMSVRFDKVENLLTDVRLAEAHKEGEMATIKRLAGYVSAMVAAAISVVGAFVTDLFR
jgi:anti-sigma-K factor RskA